MDKRTRTFFNSLRRAAAVVHAYPDLRTYANESRAFDLFVGVIDDLERLERDRISTALELRQLAAQKKQLTEEVHRLVDSICTTALLIPNSVPLPTLTLPSTKQTTFFFSASALAIVDAMAAHAHAFIESGLHPRTFDDARALIARLVDADRSACYLGLHTLTYEPHLAATLQIARIRKRQVELELERVMTTDALIAWRRASSLGRTHRKALPGPPEQKLLAAGPPEGTGGIKRLARQVGLRFARGENADAS